MFSNAVLRNRANNRFEDREAVCTSERRLTRALRMRHQSDDVTLLVAQAGNVRRRAIWIRRISDHAVRVGITEDHLAVLLEARDDIGFRIIVALAVRNGHAKHLADRARSREWRVN